MTDKHFKYGPIAIGTFVALICLSVVVMFSFPNLLGYYFLFMAFLGLGLRPLIIRTGLNEFFETMLVSTEAGLERNFLKKRRMEIDRQVRDRKYRNKRVKDPRLPKNW